MRQKLNIPLQSLRMELVQWIEESEDGRTAGVELERKDQIWRDCWTWGWTRENKTKDGRTAGVEGGDGGDQPGRTRLRPQRLHCGGVLRGGGHFSSFLLWVVQHDFARLVISKTPMAWTLPKRSSLTMSQVRSRMRWVFDTIQNHESWQCLLFAKYCGFRCEKLTRALTQCFLEGIALLDRFEFDFWTKEQ